ncbi:hypothetical protein J2Z35_001678 [Acetoanaerobium pronyense]|uniref:Uncharacterized protein n=1 Tax=Acetoanaerobium pronyense TaxID=1482736 RepID=A0ABS4KJA8_9FIRM|nr:hypothetical protein [Acetoanaerobium pronyense]MBP2027880.1 hypothetical protein [Acetoanaerobium pronyense]
MGISYYHKENSKKDRCINKKRMKVKLMYGLFWIMRDVKEYFEKLSKKEIA